MFFDELGRDANDMLALPVLDQVEGLKGVDDVRLSDGGDPTQVGNAQRPTEVPEDLQ